MDCGIHFEKGGGENNPIQSFNHSVPNPKWHFGTIYLNACSRDMNRDAKWLPNYCVQQVTVSRYHRYMFITENTINDFTNKNSLLKLIDSKLHRMIQDGIYKIAAFFQISEYVTQK